MKFIIHIFLTYLLRIGRFQQWYKNLKLDSGFLGVPPNEKKIWNALKQDIHTIFMNIYKVQSINIRTIKVRIQVKKFKPIKPSKKFVITLTNLPLSVQATERCIKSCRQYGEDNNLEIVSAVDKFNSQKFFTDNNLTWYENYSIRTEPFSGMGCFSSHFKLWLRCIDLGEPIIILEHDAILHSSIPQLRFKHIIMIGKPYFHYHILRSIPHKGKKREVALPWPYIAGTHAYAITPEGAHKLVKQAPQQLLPPVDVFMSRKNIDVLYLHPAPIELDVRFSSVANA